MIRKYPWHFVYLIFVLLCLSNIFQKLKWYEPTDFINWQETAQGMLCSHAPETSSIKTGDMLLTVNKYIVKSRIDLYRVIQNRHYCRYEIERQGIIKVVGMDVTRKYTPLSYYILVFAGLLSILLTLNLLNSGITEASEAPRPVIFYLLNLAFSGLVIFSPTGSFNLLDFAFLGFDRLCYAFFPAFLLHFALYFPTRSPLIRRFGRRCLLVVYAVPSAILLLYALFLIQNILYPLTELLTLVINYFRSVLHIYFIIFLLISLFILLKSSLSLALRGREKQFYVSSAATLLGIAPLFAASRIPAVVTGKTPISVTLALFLTLLLPLSLITYLRHQRFSDIKSIIRRTISISSIFLFIFGIYFFIGLNIEQNKLLGIFWSVAAILTAGYLFKPIESTFQEFIEKFFFKSTFNFKRRLFKLIQALQGERNLSELSRNFLDTIDNGFSLRSSSLLIHYRKNVFYSMPGNRKVTLSKTFREHLLDSHRLIIPNTQEFRRRYARECKNFKSSGFFQFLALETPGKLTGVVAIGLKKDGRYLSIEDWELLTSISPSLALSVENAFLYSELENQLSEINWLKEFNETIIENLNFGIVVLSRLNMILSWNQFMEIKFNLPRQTALNKKARQILGNDLWKKIKTEKATYITTIQTKITLDNQEIVFDISISPMRDNSGKIIGTLLLFEDVTEKIFIQNQLITTEKMASIGMLSAGIAHEINTPLTGISSYCQFMISNPDDTDNRDLLFRIQDQVNRANKIIRTLLNFSRQQGEEPVELEPGKLITESLALMEHKLKKKNIKVATDFKFTRKITGFPTRLQQLFINLLINAADAIDHNAGELNIMGWDNSEWVLVTIQDNGKGIKNAYLSNVFDPFFTTKAPGEGTGLGLSISYNIVKEHYGEIKVTSQENEGTTFHLSFPLESPLRRIKI